MGVGNGVFGAPATRLFTQRLGQSNVVFLEKYIESILTYYDDSITTTLPKWLHSPSAAGKMYQQRHNISAVFYVVFLIPL